MPITFQIKDETEKTRFFSGLTNEKLDTFPKDVCTKKILPELLKAFDYSNAGAQIIAPVFKVTTQSLVFQMKLAIEKTVFLDIVSC